MIKTDNDHETGSKNMKKTKRIEWDADKLLPGTGRTITPLDGIGNVIAGVLNAANIQIVIDWECYLPYSAEITRDVWGQIGVAAQAWEDGKTARTQAANRAMLAMREIERKQDAVDNDCAA